MEKVNPIEFLRRLRDGEKVICPKCGMGRIVTPHDPKTSHFFHCEKCDLIVNID